MIKKGCLGKRSSPPNHTKYFVKILPMAISIIWPSFSVKWCTIKKIYAKIYLYLEAEEIVSNMKNWMSQKPNMKIVSQRLHFQKLGFLVNITFKSTIYLFYCFYRVIKRPKLFLSYSASHEIFLIENSMKEWPNPLSDSRLRSAIDMKLCARMKWLKDVWEPYK